MTLICSVLIDAPVRVVFGFHERDDVLELLSPAFPPVRVVSRSGGIEVGARVELHAGWVTWAAVHTAYEKDALFVDEQVSGPFAKWVHRHEFEDIGEMTRLTDRVEYELRGGPIVNEVFGWIVRVAMKELFRFRHRVTKRMCEAQA